MVRSRFAVLITAIAAFAVFGCRQSAEAASGGVQYLKGYVPAKETLLDVKDDALQSSIKQILTLSDSDIVNKPIEQVFPALEALKKIITDAATSGTKTFIIYGNVNVRRAIDILYDNPAVSEWINSIEDPVLKRNIYYAMRWCYQFSADVAVKADLDNPDILYNVVYTNIYNPYVQKQMVERGVTPDELSNYKKLVFEKAKATGIDEGPAYKEEFINRVASMPATEALKTLRAELDALIPKLNPSNAKQVEWINQLRYILKIKSEVVAH